MSYGYVTMQWVLWVSWCSFRPCEEEGVLINPLEPTGGMWAQIFLHEHPGVWGCGRKVAFVFLWCFVYQCKTWQPCLGTVSWVCKNAKPVALKMPEPLGSKYEHTVLLTPDRFQEDFSYPFFWTSFKVPNSSSCGQRFLTGFCIAVGERETALSHWGLLCMLKLLSLVHFQCRLLKAT